MAEVKLDKILQMKRLEPDDKLNTIVKNGLQKLVGPEQLSQEASPLWDANYFGLHNSKVFNGVSPEQQQDIVKKCSAGFLNEALFIEQSGLAFGAKMSLLAESVEERMLYGLFMADETTHYHHVRRFLPELGAHSSPNEFHYLLTQLIEEGDRESLVFSIQVVLEGWGLTHYRSLADGCLSPAFQEVLHSILRDEARHHGSGIILCKRRGLPPQSREFVFEILSNFLGMVQMGPQAIVQALEEVSGNFTRVQRIKAFEELDTLNHSQQRLTLLKSLMEQDGFHDIVAKLDSYKLFKAKSAGECA